MARSDSNNTQPLYGDNGENNVNLAMTQKNHAACWLKKSVNHLFPFELQIKQKQYNKCTPIAKPLELLKDTEVHRDDDEAIDIRVPTRKQIPFDWIKAPENDPDSNRKQFVEHVRNRS